ncbi:MAG: 3-deoxy-7-phosphoheptulonate synthase [Erysipelotrichales bacterium]|nr:3-deoxy-7-phosphoheptulonate synthase [Erysipelotrichales bacterium]
MKIYLNKTCDLSEIKHNLDAHNVFFDIHEIDEKLVLFIDDLDFQRVNKIINAEFIEDIMPIYDLKLTLRLHHPEDTIIKVKNCQIGGNKKVVIAGPCAVEDENTMRLIGQKAKKCGVNVLRGGAFKPRTNPYSFQGLYEHGLSILKNIGDEFDLPIISEITDIDYLDKFIECVDIIQVGARNMQNFALLEKLGKVNKPILLKRGFNNTIEELLCSAEYIMKNGNEQVILCERGIRTPLSYTRSTLDLSSVAILKEVTHLPVIVDPSHGTGKRKLILPMSKASFSVGADGVLLEAHISPNKAMSDSEQTISFEEVEKIIKSI